LGRFYSDPFSLVKKDKEDYKMVRVDFDDLGVPAIDLETNDNIYRTVIIKTPKEINLFIYNILGNDASNGKYLFPFKKLDTRDYEVLVYDQDKEVEYSDISHLSMNNFPIDKATQGFILRERADTYDHLINPVYNSYDSYDNYDYQRMQSKGKKEKGKKDEPGPFFPLKGKKDKVYFKPDNDLSEREQKYCSCLLKVGSKGTAYNKYAVCAKSVGTTSRRCRQNYDLPRLSGQYRTEAEKKH